MLHRFLALGLLATTARSVLASPLDLGPRQGTATVNTPDPTITNDPENSLYPPAQSIVVNPSPNPTLISQLELAATSVDRFTILKQYGEQGIKFDFNIAANPSGGVSAGLGGQGNLADRKTFPALITLGVAMSAGFLQPCGMVGKVPSHLVHGLCSSRILCSKRSLRSAFALTKYTSDAHIPNNGPQLMRA